MRPGTLLTAICCLAVLALGVAPAHAQTVQLTPFGGQAYGGPYFVTGGAGDAGRVYVVESDGEIRLVRDGVTQATAFLDISPDVLVGGETGMFSMALAPDYPASGLFYVFYTRDDPTPGNQHFLIIEEFRRSASNPDVADPASRRVVMSIDHFTAGNHNGGQLQFGPDGLLYISVGDGGNTPNLAQDLTSRLGKLLRIDPRGAAPGQYTIPADNPFKDGAGGNADEIYSYGLRNPYRFSFDRYTGDLIIGDVGGGTKEELDFALEGTARGGNFGWPCVEGNTVQSTSGICAPPLANYTPPAFDYRTGAGIGGSAAVNAGYVIRDPALPGHAGRFEYTDTYGDLPGVRTVQLSAGTSSGDASLGVTQDGLVFTSGQDACGHLYIGQSGSGGVVSRLEPTGGGSLACKTAPELRQVKTKSAKKALKKKGIPVTVTCDVDCTVTATGTVDRLVRRKRRPQVRGATVGGARIQGGSPTTVLLKLSKGQRKRLRKWLRKSGTQVRVLVDAQGAGGGTATGGAQVPLATKKK